MKNKVLLLSVAVAFAACSSPSTQTTKTDSTVTVDTSVKSTAGAANKVQSTASLCFVNTAGKNNLDTTGVELVIKGDTVHGEMHWLPYQKDSRKGILSGFKHNDMITAVWTFKQEGTTDTMKLDFKLDSNRLLQKPLKLNKTTGRQQTDETAGYSVAYRPSVVLKH